MEIIVKQNIRGEDIAKVLKRIEAAGATFEVTLDQNKNIRNIVIRSKDGIDEVNAYSNYGMEMTHTQNEKMMGSRVEVFTDGELGKRMATIGLKTTKIFKGEEHKAKAKEWVESMLKGTGLAPHFSLDQSAEIHEVELRNIAGGEVEVLKSTQDKFEELPF